MRAKRLSGWLLIAIGLIFLARNLGFFEGSIQALFKTWWPLIPLAVGMGALLGKR